MAKDLVRTRRYIQKFYQMKTQLQAVSLRIQVSMHCRSKMGYNMTINAQASTKIIVLDIEIDTANVRSHERSH